MEFTKNKTFNPTPNLKSSPVPIYFISFNGNDENCNFCGLEFSNAIYDFDKYCKSCLTWYIKYLTDNDIYLDICIGTNNIQCSDHEPRNSDFMTHKIQEWCLNCSEILYFGQPFYSTKYLYHQNKRKCLLCGKDYIYNGDICHNCYLISNGRAESTFIKKSILIIYLPLWYSRSYCISCDIKLNFVTDCQKWCSYCFVVYIGCRYCLTTNIIFGIADQSQCMKCKRVVSITIDVSKFVSGNSIIDEFIYYTKFNSSCKIVDDLIKYNEIYKLIRSGSFTYDLKYILPMEWIPYTQITSLIKIAEGGYGIVYRATRLNPYSNSSEVVAIKRILHSQTISKSFLNELKSLYHCNDTMYANIIRCYGVTQDPDTKEFMLIMMYANGGDLHNHLQKKFEVITWRDKLRILHDITWGLYDIHVKNIIHRDLHSGNILNSSDGWCIGDLGLSQPADGSLNNEIYGVIPYIAPEVFKGVKFSKESDIYSLGMVMWELTSGRKPFDNIEHDTDLIYAIIDGKRPEITQDTPEFYANLMKRCWDPDPSKRLLITEIYSIVSRWSPNYQEFKQAEMKRLKLIQSMKLGPKFSEQPHPKAIFTSRALSSLISKSSSINLSIEHVYNTKQEYISIEYDLNIRSSLINVDPTSQNSSNIQRSKAVDINISSCTYNSTTYSSKKRRIEE